jgi:hypothetical protein
LHGVKAARNISLELHSYLLNIGGTIWTILMIVQGAVNMKKEKH